MGKASRKKRELRELEMEDLPEHLRFGPEYVNDQPEWVDLVVQAGVATASGKGCDS
jgi:hypothetical protein